MARVTKAQAEKALKDAGWKLLHPNTPLYDVYWFDGENRNHGMAWLSAYEELMRRSKPKQLPLFSV